MSTSKVANQEFQHLSNAPVTEAVIDIRLELPSGFSLDSFNTISEELKTTFPVKKTQHMVRGEIKFDPSEMKNQSQSVSDEVSGFLFYSPDEKEIVQIRKNGFTFSRLAPYTSWNEIFPKFKELWAKYNVAAGEGTITRIAVRYINKLQLPISDAFLWNHYLTAPPTIPPNVSDTITYFQTKVFIHPTQEIVISLTQSTEPSNNNDILPFILDIDVFKEVKADLSDETIIAEFELLKYWENKTFFNSLTQNAIALCQ